MRMAGADTRRNDACRPTARIEADADVPDAGVREERQASNCCLIASRNLSMSLSTPLPFVVTKACTLVNSAIGLESWAV